MGGFNKNNLTSEEMSFIKSPLKNFSLQELQEEIDFRKKELISNQEKSFQSWKDAWWDQCSATGKMAWEIPNPYYLSDKQKAKIPIWVLKGYSYLFTKRMSEGLKEFNKKNG